MLSAAQVAINHCRIRCAGVGEESDAASLRLRISDALGSAALTPSDMPPMAILIVRRLDDPLPGYAVDDGPAPVVASDWERAAQTSLSVQYRTASRPALGAPPADAPAVAFTDETELLACLAWDMATGTARNRWWWNALLGALPDMTFPALASLLIREATYVPSMIQNLTESGRAAAVSRALTPLEGINVLEAVCRECGLGASVIDTVCGRLRGKDGGTILRGAPPPAVGQPSSRSTKPDDEPPARARRSIAVSPPWEAWFPSRSVNPNLGRERIALLGVSLALHYRPAAVTTARFLAGCRVWWQTDRGGADTAGEGTAPTATPPPAGGDRTTEVTGTRVGAPDSRLTSQYQPPPRIPEPVDADAAVPVPHDGPSADLAPSEPAVYPVAPLPGSERPCSSTDTVSTASSRDTGNSHPEIGTTLTPNRRSRPSLLRQADTNNPLTEVAQHQVQTVGTPYPNESESSPEAGIEGHLGYAKPEARESRVPTRPPSARISAEIGHGSPRNPGRPAVDSTTTGTCSPTADAPKIVDREDRVARRPDRKRHALPRAEEAVASVPEPASSSPPSSLPIAELGVETGLAGVFYLLNAMRWLDLPQCFEEACGLASRVGAWGLLETLARALLGRLGEAFANDPVWELLAELDSRLPGEAPGSRFVGSDAFRLPPAWLAGLVSDCEPWRATSNAGRLRVWSSRGFLLLDVPRQGRRMEAQARAELARYAAPDVSTRVVRSPAEEVPVLEIELAQGPTLEAALNRWLKQAMPYITWRLARALGVRGADRERLAQALLMHEGRLFVSASHVDLVTGLGDVSLPVRYAGLDRDPGWLPQFSRVVQFHFE